jgi:ABC-type amino acid transport substrate-binding protein
MIHKAKLAAALVAIHGAFSATAADLVSIYREAVVSDAQFASARAAYLAGQEKVVQGKAAAFIYDQMSVFQNAQRNPGKVRALLAPLQRESWAIALRREDGTLLAEVNAFLTNFRADGGFTKLADQYLADEKAAFAAQGIPFVF